MPIGQYHRSLLPLSGVPVYACFSMLFVFLLFPLNASASSSVSSTTKPTFQVNAGFNSRYRDSNWVPVQVSLRNDGADFNGFISINVPAPSVSITRSSPTLTYQQAITLPTSAQKQVTLNIPISLGDQGSTQSITVSLLDTNNQKISSETTTLRSIGPSDIFVGILSDQTTGFGPVSTVPLADPTASILVESLDATTMPTMTAVLKNFDLLILDNFTTSNLSKSQLTALQNWVNWGGSLIVVGGPEWRNSLSPLPADLLPVSLTGTETLPAKTSLLPIGGPMKGGPVQHLTPDTVQGAVIASTAIPSPHTTVALASASTPLLVQKKQGLGLVCYLAFDPTLNPVLNWSGIGALWQGLFLRMLGDQLLTSGPNIAQSGSSVLTPDNSSGGFSGLLQSSLPNMLPPTWLLLALLLGYVAVLGPIRLLLVRLLKQRDWSWRITLSAIVIFSALSYTLTLQQKGTSIVSSSISILQLGQPDASGTPAHVTTYVGVYLPNQGNFQVNVPGSNLVQTYTESSSSQGQPATIISADNETAVKLQGTNTWSLHTLVTKQDRHVSGSIIPHLTFHSNNLLRGTVTNSLPYALNNTYLLIGNHFQSLGTMAAGETRMVSLAVENPPNSSNNFLQTSLADQIAASNNLQVPYLAYNDNTQSLSALQRHMAQIAILSGENAYDEYCGAAPCFQSAQPFAMSNGVLVNSSSTLISGNGPSTQVSGRDPLLLPGAPATLIGWVAPASHSADTIDVTGSHIAGAQETFLQAPLAVDFADPVNQTVTVPSDMLTGQLIDAQSQSAQTQSPGIYTLNAGSMTFEFALPAGLQLHNGNITLTEPSTLTQGNIPLGQGITAITDVNHMRISLYNWQKHTWGSFAFNQFSLSINNAQAYIDSSGRIVMQFTNQNASQGTAVFSKPSLQLSGLLTS
jgi:hypothetical protein